MACSFHVMSTDLFFEVGSTALTKKSQTELQSFVSKAEKFHYIDRIEIVSHTGHELVSFNRLQGLARERSHVIKGSFSSLKVWNDRLFASNVLPSSPPMVLAKELEKNARVDVAVWGWRSRPIQGTWCGIGCPCFEKE
jgi:outer membrane protein OmpA-like peptidoglycan-associated protein